MDSNGDLDAVDDLDAPTDDGLDWGDPDEPLGTVRVENAALLEEGDYRLFPFEREGWEYTAIMIRARGQLHCYVNRCPHVPYSLDIGDGRLKDKSGKFLICSNHGAMFLPESGECFMGPVVGRSLERFSFELDGDDAIVTIVPEPDDWP